MDTPLLQRANVLSVALRDTTAQNACPLCLQALSDELVRDRSASALLLVDCHEFFDACVAALIRPRSDEAVDAFRHLLQENLAACDKHKTNDDLVHVFVNACATAVFAGLRNAVDRAKQPGKAFSNQRGRPLWPVKPGDLFPHGVDASITSLVTWCERLGADADFLLLVLAQYLAVARSRVWPALTASADVHRRMVEIVVAHLDGPGAIRPKSIEAAGKFLSQVLEGPGAQPDDEMQFTLDYPAKLLVPITLALHEIAETDPAFDILSRYALILQRRTGMPEKLLPPSVLRQRAPQPALPDVMLSLFKNILAARRSCAYSGCTSAACGAELQECAGCHAMRYCSRACQREDWKKGSPVPHERVCPAVGSVLPLVSVDVSSHEFSRRFAAAGLDARQTHALTFFALGHAGPYSISDELKLRLKSIMDDLLRQSGLPTMPDTPAMIRARTILNLQ